MRMLLQNLLITFALGLCVLVAVQWHRESKLRGDADRLAVEVAKDRQTIETLRTDLKRANDEITRVDSLRKQLATKADGARSELERTTGELRRSELEQQRLSRELDSHKAALDQANANITTQNETMKQLATDRDEAVTKFNTLVEDHNALVKQWNAQQQTVKPKK